MPAACLPCAFVLCSEQPPATLNTGFVEFEALDDFDMELEDTSFLDDVSVPTTDPGAVPKVHAS